jgi:hypothetical protein
MLWLHELKLKQKKNLTNLKEIYNSFWGAKHNCKAGYNFIEFL